MKERSGLDAELPSAHVVVRLKRRDEAGFVAAADKVCRVVAIRDARVGGDVVIGVCDGERLSADLPQPYVVKVIRQPPMLALVEVTSNPGLIRWRGQSQLVLEAFLIPVAIAAVTVG